MDKNQKLMPAMPKNDTSTHSALLRDMKKFWALTHKAAINKRGRENKNLKNKTVKSVRSSAIYFTSPPITPPNKTAAM